MSLSEHWTKPRKKRFQKQEERIAKEGGGFKTPASGGVVKGDVRTDRFVREAKQTMKARFVLPSKVLKKICDEARGHGYPSLEFEMSQLENTIYPMDWTMIPRHVFEELLEAAGWK